jgi:tRNA (Thr-GGU) A37 N-methylase/ribosomal protein S18 acetylase RimI-like enzyme
MIKIREAQVKDASLLVESEQRIAATPGMLVSHPHEIKIEAFQTKIKFLNKLANGISIVAENDQQIVGHAWLEPSGLEAIEHVLRLTIAVHIGHQEQGVGEKILSYLIDWAKAVPNVEKIELNVRAVNLRAIRLYQKLGFNIEGRIRHRIRTTDSRYMDDLQMGLFVKKNPPTPSVVCLAIGKVVSNRKEAIDDDWDSVESYVLLDGEQFSPEALLGLDSFSHAEVIFYMNQVDISKIENSSRHPRNNTEWPKVGIFAQRGKNRPNQIASTICRVKGVDGLRLYLEGLDAVDGTPVVDIKPWVKEFGPRGIVSQPIWMNELMIDYWIAGDK